MGMFSESLEAIVEGATLSDRILGQVVKEGRLNVLVNLTASKTNKSPVVGQVSETVCVRFFMWKKVLDRGWVIFLVLSKWMRTKIV